MRTDAIKLTQNQQALLRRQAVRYRSEGRSNAEAAMILGVHEKTVSSWWARYGRIGDALFEPGKRGRPQGGCRRLTDLQEGEVQRLIAESTPDRLKLSFVLWTRSSVSAIIEHRYHIRLPVRTLDEYMRRWGYSQPRPQQRARKRGDHAMETWLDETYPKIVKEARNEAARLFWGDQIGVCGDPVVAPEPAPRPRAAGGEENAVWIALSMMRAVTNRGAVSFLIYKGSLDASLLVRFCGRLVTSAEGRTVHLILDDLPIHHARAFLRWTEDHRQHFTVVYLPAIPG